MTIAIILICILALILLVSWGKVNAFLAFLLVSVTAALLLGVPPENINASIQKGIGDTLGSLMIIIALGAMLGKLVAESGAAEKITHALMQVSGEKNIQWALMITGFIVGIPLFYTVGFVLFVPLILSVAYTYKLPAVYIGIPMLASLSVTHGFLPPHPSPAALVTQFHADMGVTLMYGLIIAIPAIILAGPVFARTLKNIRTAPIDTFQPKEINRQQLPGTFNSFITSLLPVILLITFTVMNHTAKHGKSWIVFLGDPSIVIFLSLIVATFTLGIRNGRSLKTVMNIYAEALTDVSMILFIIAGAGILKQVFADSGAGEEIALLFTGLHIHPLLLAWLITTILRICLGSATIAGLTAAGIVAPLIAHTHTDPNLMVLSIGAGSLMCSHVNDAGFWLFKQYFNLSIKDTLRSWTIMETIVGVTGIIGVMIINAIIS